MLKNFIEKSNNVKRDAFLWNLIASAVNASEAIIILMIATRTVGIEEAGMLSIAFTVANLMLTIGKYGMRNFQVTDANDKYSFATYLNSRIFTVGMMVFATVVYVLYSVIFNNYSWHKSIIVFLVVLIYAVEAFEDVFVSEFQHKERLDIGSKLFALRWMGTLLVWSVGLIFLKDSIISASIALMFDMMLLFILLKLVRPTLCELVEKKDLELKTKFWGVLKECSPLFAGGFLAYYITNASKYAIDACLSDEVQACYGFVAMPIFVIGLLNMIIYQPILVRMSIEWENGERKSFVIRIIKQMIVIVVLALLCLAGAWVLGIPVLSMLYATDLTEYKMVLMLLLIGGMWLAFAGFFAAVITIMRKQKWLLVGYVVIAIVAIVSSNSIVLRFGVDGAAFSNMLWTFAESVIFGMIVLINILVNRNS